MPFVVSPHQEVRIETIGLRLDLPQDRYQHTPRCPWSELQKRMVEWDVGIAPLADIPFNRARSNVKLKEYASIGLPWLASRTGGSSRTTSGSMRFLCWPRADATAGSWGGPRGKWAKRQSIERHAGRWDAVLEAVQRRQRRGALV